VELTINYRQIHRSRSLDDLTKIKTERLLKKFQMDGNVIWTFSRKEKNYIAEIYFKSQGNQFHAESSSDNFFKTLEFNLHKLEIQLDQHLMEQRRWTELSL